MDEQDYIKERLEKQIIWYDEKSLWNQKWFKRLKWSEIIFSALIPILILLSEQFEWIKIIIGILGALVTVSVAINGLYNFHDNWISYRITEETLKHEKYLFNTETGIYEDKDKKFNLFVQRVEQIINKETLSWSSENTVDKSVDL